MRPSDDVRLVVTAGPGQAYRVGALVAAVATTMEFDSYTVGDIRMAAEELALMLVEQRPPTAVKCEIGADDWAATVRLSAVVRPAPALPNPDGYRWHALMTLTDSLCVTGDGAKGPAGGRVEVCFSRRRVGGPPLVRERDAREPTLRNADTGDRDSAAL